MRTLVRHNLTGLTPVYPRILKISFLRSRLSHLTPSAILLRGLVVITLLFHRSELPLSLTENEGTSF